MILLARNGASAKLGKCHQEPFFCCTQTSWRSCARCAALPLRTSVCLWGHASLSVYKVLTSPLTRDKVRRTPLTQVRFADVQGVTPEFKDGTTNIDRCIAGESCPIRGERKRPCHPIRRAPEDTPERSRKRPETTPRELEIVVKQSYSEEDAQTYRDSGTWPHWPPLCLQPHTCLCAAEVLRRGVSSKPSTAARRVVGLPAPSCEGAELLSTRARLDRASATPLDPSWACGGSECGTQRLSTCPELVGLRMSPARVLPFPASTTLEANWLTGEWATT